MQVLYADITALKHERDWRGGHWLLLAFTGGDRPLQLGNGEEELAVELLQAIAAQGM